MGGTEASISREYMGEVRKTANESQGPSLYLLLWFYLVATPVPPCWACIEDLGEYEAKTDEVEL